MAFVLIIAVSFILQICDGQVNNLPNNNGNKQNNVPDPEKGFSKNIPENTQFKGGTINYANYNPQTKFPEQQISKGLHLKLQQIGQTANTPLTNQLNNPQATLPTQQTFQIPFRLLPSALQQINLQGPANPTISCNSLNSPINTNIDAVSNSIISSVPVNNYPEAVPSPIAETNPISSSLVSFLPSTVNFEPTTYPSLNVLQQLSNVRDSPEANQNEVYLKILRSPQTFTNIGDPTVHTPNTYINNAIDESSKSITFKELLPLILNLLKEDNDYCPCCSTCKNCRQNKNNKVIELPTIDSGYSKERKYSSVEENKDDNEATEEDHSFERKLEKYLKAKKYAKIHKNNKKNEEIEDYESDSEEE